MRYLSLFSGIEAATVAWHQLGWTPVAFAEIEPFPCAVLAHHYPDVPNLGNVTEITDERIAALGPIDLVVGGSPCQDLSLAGKRKGLAGKRSSLFHQQVRIFNAARNLCAARFLVWENVPGAFSSNSGRDFAIVVSAMAGCNLDVPDGGWGTEGVALGNNGLVEWSVLDAQWFGVAQRRRRVFAVLDTGTWADRAPILLEPDSLRGDTAPRRESRQGIAPTISARTQGGGGLGTDFDIDGGLIPVERTSPPQNTHIIPEVSMCLNAGAMGRQDAETEMLIPTIGGIFDVGPNENIVQVTFDTTQITSKENGSNPRPGDPCHPLAAGAHPPAIVYQCHGGNIGPMGTLRTGGNGSSGVPFTLAIRGRDGGHDLEYRQDDTANAILTPKGGRGGIGVGAIAFPERMSATQHAAATELSPSLCSTNPTAVAFQPSNHDRGLNDQNEHAAIGMAVRRLTPEECEALQGFPRGYTRIPLRRHKKKRITKLRPADRWEEAEGGWMLMAADGPRYKALGNSMATVVMLWIGGKIQKAVAAQKDAA